MSQVPSRVEPLPPGGLSRPRRLRGAATHTTWCGEWGGLPVTITEVAGCDLERLETAVEQARRLSGPGFSPPRGLIPLDGQRALVLAPPPAGPSLHELTRSPLLGPTLRIELVIHLAGHRARAHAAEVVHGHLSLLSVEVDSAMRPVLVDLGLSPVVAAPSPQADARAWAGLAREVLAGLDLPASLARAVAQAEQGTLEPPVEATPPGGVGQRFGPYRVLGELGRGANGVVYRALHAELDREVALKVVPAAGPGAEQRLARLRIEARAAARLRHPGIVSVHDQGEVPGAAYVVFDLIDGESLAERLRRGPLAPRSALELGRDLARALEHAHGHGVLHRDLKPENVLLVAGDRPMLTDFGLAKLDDMQAGLTRTGQLLGTPAYMSPEQARGEGTRAGPAADVYGLGATLYAALTGDPPFAGETLQELWLAVTERAPVAPWKRRPEVGRGASELVLRCLEKDPARRPPGAAAVAEELERLLGVARPARAWMWAWPAAGLFVGAAVAAMPIGVGGEEASGRSMSLGRVPPVAPAAASAEQERLLARARAARPGSEAAQQAAATLLGLGPAADPILLRALREAPGPVLSGEADEPAGSAAWVACEVLRHRAGWPGGALEGLGAYLGREQHQGRALMAAKALVCEGSPAALIHVLEAWGRFGPDSRYHRGVALLLWGIDPRRLPRWGDEVRSARLRALALEAVGQLEPAEGELEQLLRRPPEHPGPGLDRAWAQLARVRLARSDLDGAEAACVEALRRGVDPLALAIRSDVRCERGDPLQATRDAEAALQQAPQLVAGWRALVRALVRSGRSSEALRALDMALERWPIVPLLHLRGSLRARSQDFAGACRDFETLLGLEPEHAFGWSDLSHARAEAGELRSALAASDEAVRLAPELPVARGNRSRILRLLGRPGQALGEAEIALRLVPGDRALLLRRAEARRDLGDVVGALEDAATLLSDAPPLAEGLALRGSCLLLQGQIETARRDALRATELDPRCLAGWVLRSAVSRAAGAVSLAQEEIARALELVPSVEVLAERREVRIAAGELDAALEDAQVLVELRGGAADYRALGSLLAVAENSPAAARAYAAASELEPDRLETRLEAYDALSRARDLERARQVLEAGFARFGARSGLLVRRAADLREQGDLPGALAACQEALALAGGDRRALFERGVTALALGSREQARQDLGAALAPEGGGDPLPPQLQTMAKHALASLE